MVMLAGQPTTRAAEGPAAQRLRPAPRLILASQSPRRRKMLAERGYQFEVVEPGFDDASLVSGRVDPAAWVASLAYLKARAVIQAARSRGQALVGAVVLGADTMVVDGGRIIGKPADAGDALAMIRALRGHDHHVVTGVALIDVDGDTREVFADAARVHLGDLDDEVLGAYVAGGAWRGKAGGYNLEEVQRTGWPVSYHGDPGTVMGLPMQALAPRLAARGLVAA